MIKTVGEFVNLVLKMREAQQQYFRTRRLSDLNDSKKFESQVDDEIVQFYKRCEEKDQPGLGM